MRIVSLSKYLNRMEILQLGSYHVLLPFYVDGGSVMSIKAAGEAGVEESPW